MKDWTHRQLCEDLAIAKETIFIEVSLGSKWMTRPTPPIADVLVVRPSYTRFCVDIFEVKKSRADLLSDIRSEKWKSYLPFCHRFYYAIASGITNQKEIPNGCGLLIRGEIGWRTIKQSKAREIELPSVALMSLLFYREKPPHNINRRYGLRYYWQYEKNLLKKRGEALSKLLTTKDIRKAWNEPRG